MLSQHKYKRFADFLCDRLKQVQKQGTSIETVYG